MNAILSLCHFCELHGPRVLFNTQAFRDPPPLSDALPEKNIEKDESNANVEVETDYMWKYGRINKGQTYKAQPSFNSETCSACRSFTHNQAALISNDDENCVSFVSSQYPFQDEIFALLRQAGIRSLSCEAYSEREGAIYFGDNARGHVISYTFFLKDIQARGFLRRYSILVMMADKMFLLNSWSFFIKYLQEAIKLLQDRATKVYHSEEKQQSHQLGLKPPVTSENSKRHRAAGNPRPLTELVGDRSIWTTLHSRFTWILKVGGLRLQEKLVEGPPLFVPEVDQRQMSIVSLMDLITTKYFHKILHHIYVGNKVVFESSNEKLLIDIPLVLKPIVPSYHFHPVHLGASEVGHKDIETSNMITICGPSSKKVFLPYFTLQLFPPSSESENNENVLSYDVEAIEPFSLVTRPPQIVSKIFSLVENGKFSNSVLNLYFATLIDEWTNKVKIWSYVSRNNELLQMGDGGHSSLSPNLLSPIASPSIYEKRGYISRSPSPTPSLGSSASCGGANTLLTVVGALECDIPMLTALSKSYENAVTGSEAGL